MLFYDSDNPVLQNVFFYLTLSESQDKHEVTIPVSLHQ